MPDTSKTAKKVTAAKTRVANADTKLRAAEKAVSVAQLELYQSYGKSARSSAQKKLTAAKNRAKAANKALDKARSMLTDAEYEHWQAGLKPKPKPSW